ncbi:uncharacterized protein LOC107047062, partial [Diachasma alloeum]
MRRWRQQHRPPVPRTLQEYDEIINLPQWSKYRQYAGGGLTVHTINVAVDTSVTVFGDTEFLASISNIRELLIDATFEVCPRAADIYQFLTIMGRIDDSCVPITWALMTRKTEQAYVAVFQYFKLQLAPLIQPTNVSLDYELASSNAIRHVYRDIRGVYCYFHLVH